MLDESLGDFSLVLSNAQKYEKVFRFVHLRFKKRFIMVYRELLFADGFASVSDGGRNGVFYLYCNWIFDRHD